jgi:hypothetical protein
VPAAGVWAAVPAGGRVLKPAPARKLIQTYSLRNPNYKALFTFNMHLIGPSILQNDILIRIISLVQVQFVRIPGVYSGVPWLF